MNPRYSSGSVTLLVIVFAAIFFAILVAMSGFVLSGNRIQDVTRQRTEAFSIAEAGLDYYRWFLSHYPGNTQNGTGHNGPFVISYNDPETSTSAGTYTLTITGNSACGNVQSIDVTSKGVPADAPGTSVTLVSRYAQPSVAAYSYIVNSSVWAGSDRVINGPYHSNGGVRMDGTANAPVTSSVTTWNCDSNFGCSPTQAAAPGVVGTGPNQTLWTYPTPQIDFAAIAANFTSLKTTAQASGLFYDRISSGNSNSAAYYKGYHLIFNAAGTVTVYKVVSTTKQTVTPVNPAFGTDDRTRINNETLLGTYTVPSTCGVIFVQDHAWIEGTVAGKVTVVAADVTNVGVVPYVVLEDNILYNLYDGSAGLTVISEGDVLIAPDAPTNLTLNGTFIAQGGAFGRNLYACPGSYEPKGTLTISGTTVSNLRTGTKWINGCGGSDGGYQTRIDSYDRLNASNPPPFTPVTSTSWQFVDWQQK